MSVPGSEHDVKSLPVPLQSLYLDNVAVEILLHFREGGEGSGELGL